MGYGKGRATGYTDFYKNNSNTTEDEDREKSYSLSISMSMPKVGQAQKNADTEETDKRKLALKRMLQKRRAGK